MLAEWYNLKIKKWQFEPEIITHHIIAGLAVLKDNCVGFLKHLLSLLLMC